MSVDVIMGPPEESVDVSAPSTPRGADELFAKNAFRMVYQTNNFFLPQHDRIRHSAVCRSGSERVLRES